MKQEPTTSPSKPQEIKIDLTGIEHKFSASGRQVCADCGKDFSKLTDEDRDDYDGDTIPLLLWKNNGRLMLTLCWTCAKKRMQPKERSFAE